MSKFAQTQTGLYVPSAALAGEITVPQLESPLVQRNFTERNPEVVSVLGCGDERLIAIGAIALLSEQLGIEFDGNFLRSFGGAAQLPNLVLRSLAINGVDVRNKDYADLDRGLRQRLLTEANIIGLDHTAIQNEDLAFGELGFNPDSSKDLACARLGAHGLVTDLAVYDKNVHDKSMQVQGALFGDDFIHEQVLGGLKASSNQDTGLASNLGNLSLGRDYVAEIGSPVMLLRGSHASPEKARICINFETNTISHPDEETFVVDATQVTEALMRALPEFDLDPRVIMSLFIHDVCATSAALAGSATGNMSPNTIQLVRNGDPRQAMAYLMAQKETLGHVK